MLSYKEKNERKLLAKIEIQQKLEVGIEPMKTMGLCEVLIVRYVKDV